MTRFIKILFSIILAFLLVIVVAGGVFALLFDPNAHKAQLSDWVAQKTGRQLAIHGEIERTFFPWIGVRVHDVSLGNAPGFYPQDRFLSVGQVDVRIKLLPLLTGQIEVGRVTLSNLDLALVKNRLGQSNWESLSSSQAPPTPGAGAAAPSQASSTTMLSRISIGGVEIKNARVSFMDEASNNDLVFDGLNFSVDNPGFDHAFPFTLDTRLSSVKHQWSGRLSASTQVQVDHVTLSSELTGLRLTLSPERSSLPFEWMANRVVWDQPSRGLLVEGSRLSVGGLAADLSLRATGLGKQTALEGQLSTNVFDLKSLMNSLGHPMQTRDPAALGRVGISAAFSLAGNVFSLNNVNIQLDSTTIAGNARWPDWPKPNILFGVALNQLDLDRYIASSRETASVSASPVPVANPSGTQSGSSSYGTSSLMLKGNLKADSLVASGQKLDNLSTTIVYSGGVLQLNPLSVGLYQGQSTGSVMADFRFGAARYSVNQTLSGVDLSELIKSSRMTGKANANLRLSFQGSDQATILSSLSGDIRFDVQNGALMGANISFEMSRGLSMLHHQPAPAAPADSNQTRFSDFKGAGRFDSGVFHQTELFLKSDRFQLTGTGLANLLKQTLDYHLIGSVSGQGGGPPMQIPIAVQGTFSHPVIIPDFSAIVHQKMEEKIQQVREQIKQNSPAGAGGGGPRGLAIERLLHR